MEGSNNNNNNNNNKQARLYRLSFSKQNHKCYGWKDENDKIKGIWKISKNINKYELHCRVKNTEREFQYRYTGF